MFKQVGKEEICCSSSQIQEIILYLTGMNEQETFQAQADVKAVSQLHTSKTIHGIGRVINGI